MGERQGWGTTKGARRVQKNGPNRRHLGSASEGAQVKATGLTRDELRQVEKTVASMVRDNLISQACAAKDQRVHQQ